MQKIIQSVCQLFSSDTFPEQQVDFQKADLFFLILFFIHWILAVTISAYQYNTYIFGFLGGGAITLGVAVSYIFFRGELLYRVLVAVALMAYSALFIQQNLGRIEYHFHVFVALSFLALYKDIRPLSIASLVVMLHHAVLNVLQEQGVSIFGMPIMVFNYGCGWDIVLLHAFFVLLEWYIVGWIILHHSQSFKNEVFLKNESDILNRSLEQKVAEETKKRLESDKLLIYQSKMAMMGEMIGAIAHQWRQPLNAVGIIIQDIEDAYKHGELDDKYIKDAVSDSMRTLQFMSGTIDNFRNFFSPNSVKKEFYVEDAIELTIGIVITQFKNKNITLKYDPKGRHLYFGYMNELEQVILNLLSNAKDAVLGNENRSAAEVAIDVQSSDGHIVIKVSDTGGGVPQELLERIFEPYFTTKEQGSGTGIGLYMSKEIIERHMHGKLYAYNGKDGAVFAVELPLDGGYRMEGEEV